MKTRFFVALALTLALASCTGGKSSVTTVYAKFPGAVDKISVSMDGLDSTIVVSPADSFVKFTIPKNVTTTCEMTTPYYAAEFVPDGTTIDISEDAMGTVSSVSRGGRSSVNNRYLDYNNWIKDFTQDYNVKMTEIRISDKTDDEKNEAFEQVYESSVGKYNEYHEKVIRENKDNFLGIIAILNASFEEDEQYEQAIAMLDPALREDARIQAVTKAIEDRKATAAGAMFTDFTVVQDPENPESSTARLSDYVGKGKYMLVDFWASWCGPCKGEIPNLKSVYEKFHGDNFDMLSIAVWDNPKASVDTAAAYGIAWNHIINGGKEVTDTYGIEGIPHIILFGPDGTILKRDLRGPEIEKEVAKYVE